MKNQMDSLKAKIRAEGDHIDLNPEQENHTVYFGSYTAHVGQDPKKAEAAYKRLVMLAKALGAFGLNFKVSRQSDVSYSR